MGLESSTRLLCFHIHTYPQTTVSKEKPWGNYQGFTLPIESKQQCGNVSERSLFLCTLEESLNWLAQISSNTLIYSFIPTSIPVQIKIHPQAPLAISSNGMDGDYGVW